LLTDFLRVGDGIISVEQFRPFCQHNKVLLMPLFAVQDKLRAAAMGRPFWKAMSERHVTLAGNRRVTLANLMNEVRHLLLHCNTHILLFFPHFAYLSNQFFPFLFYFQPADRELFYQAMHDQSTSGLRHMMRSVVEGVQHTLHITSPDLSECATQDAALERLFNPLWKRHSIDHGESVDQEDLGASLDTLDKPRVVQRVIDLRTGTSPSCASPSSESERTVAIR
jgi:hypothetical protein